MIVLPKGAFIVKQEEAPKEEKTDRPSLILSMEEVSAKPVKPNRGEIVFTSEELNKYQGCPVVFRENFGESITIQGEEYIYFRDFNSSIFYVITS